MDFPIVDLIEEKYRAKGLATLILQGEVYCLPGSVFIVPKSSLDYLDGEKFLTVWSKEREMAFTRRKWQAYHTPRHQIEILPPLWITSRETPMDRDASTCVTGLWSEI